MELEILLEEQDGITYKYISFQDLKDSGYLLISYDNCKLREFAGAENTTVIYSPKRDRRVIAVNMIGIINLYNKLNYSNSRDIIYKIKKLMNKEVIEMDKFREEKLSNLLDTIMHGGNKAISAALELHKLLN